MVRRSNLALENLDGAPRGALLHPASVVGARFPLPRRSRGRTALQFFRLRERLRCRWQLFTARHLRRPDTTARKRSVTLLVESPSPPFVCEPSAPQAAGKVRPFWGCRLRSGLSPGSGRGG